MRLKIDHTTRYSFERPVLFGLQQVRKTPKSHAPQRVLTWETEIIGGRKELSYDDHHNNLVELISFGEERTVFEIISRGEVELGDSSGVIGRMHSRTPLWLYKQ
ncbi:MAG: transglutaminase N-terminal domain-containing protein, partial [Pseudomonadota bacterium]